MFTGIIEEVGAVRQIEKKATGAFLTISARKVLEGTRIGDSISVNGVDVTAVKLGPDYFSADASLETLRRSNLGNLTVGSRVNLERALAVGDRLSGHIVQGHVDTTGTFLSKRQEGNSFVFRFGYPAEVGRYIVHKGSIAVDGISLTIANLTDEYFEVWVVPHTLQETNLNYLKTGDAINLEVDILAKYIERLLQRKGDDQEKKGGLTLQHLIDSGY